LPADLPTAGTTLPADLASIPGLAAVPVPAEVLPLLTAGPQPAPPAAPPQQLADHPLSFTKEGAAQLQDLLLQTLAAQQGPNSSAGQLPPSAAPPAYQGVLDRHNSYRARHQAAALAWSDALAGQAASYARRCVFAHDGGAFSGENLYASSDVSNTAYSLVNAIDMW
jgi:hypothetical protein